MKVAMLAGDAREHLREYDKLEPYFGTPVEALLEVVREIPELELHIVSCWQRVIPAPEKLGDNIWFHGLLVPKIGWLRTGYQGCVRAVRKKLKVLRPELVHGQGTERECAISAVCSGFPNVITIHGNMKAIARATKARVGSFMWCAAVLEDFTLKRAGGVLCNSAHTENLVKLRTRRTWRVANPLRLDFFKPPIHDEPSKKCTLVCVGRINELKQPLELLELADTWHLKGFRFELCFAGPMAAGDEYGKRFLAKVQQAEKAGYARFLGMQTTPQLVQLFDQSHALIHVAREEAFGLVVAEGLARNLKLFAFEVGGVVDIVSGINGVEMLDANDWSGLTDAITTWMRVGHPRLRDSSSLIRQRYHPLAIAREHLKVYRALLNTSE